MSEEAYSLIAAITCVLYAIVLWLRWRQGRIAKKLLRELEEKGIKLDPPKSPPSS